MLKQMNTYYSVFYTNYLKTFKLNYYYLSFIFNKPFRLLFCNLQCSRILFYVYVAKND